MSETQLATKAAEKYFGFTDRDDVAREFHEGTGSRWDDANPFAPAEDFPTDDQILLAVYETGSYEGSAYVLYRDKDGNLNEVEASHCSCNGLEDQFGGGLTTPEALALRIKAKADGKCYYGVFSDPEVWEAYESVVNALLAAKLAQETWDQ